MRRELKNLRRSRGFTQKSFAEKIKVNTRTYEAYEQGRRTPRYELMVTIMKILGTSDIGIFKKV